ncbi:MAG TPA: DUF6717 family protein [Parafilimonas sp.]|nr:DUF6717 family protein [Parafilimonas sp.]
MIGKLVKQTKNKLTKNNNSIFTINPYRWNNGWVFDDERVGLDKEAFVAGADTLLDRIINGRDSVTAIFSGKKFPTAQLELTFIEGDATGSIYWCEQFQHQLWLCPALFLYYPVAPKRIYLQVK